MDMESSQLGSSLELELVSDPVTVEGLGGGGTELRQPLFLRLGTIIVSNVSGDKPESRRSHSNEVQTEHV